MNQLLVVDDDPINLEIIAEFLEGAPYSLTCAEDGVAAWERLDAAPER